MISIGFPFNPNRSYEGSLITPIIKVGTLIPKLETKKLVPLTETCIFVESLKCVQNTLVL
jgi:hypothetical protein